MSEENQSPEVMDYLREFVCALTTQLKEDDERWGDTWLKRPKYGQELRTKARYDDYFDQFVNAGIPIPWLKVVGEALICWIKENHPEVCMDKFGIVDAPKHPFRLVELPSETPQLLVQDLLPESPSECNCEDCNLPDLSKLDPPPPENELLREGDTESWVKNEESLR